MSRMPIGSYLANAKTALSRTLQSKGKHPASFVIGNESADLDSITCAIVYGYIRSSTPDARKADRCIIPVTNIPSTELRLRPDLTALLKHADLKPSDLVTLDDLGKLHESLPPDSTEWTLVDHNVLQGTLGENYSKRVVGVIDHHDDEGKVPKTAEPRIIEKTGSCSSHVVNYCQSFWDSIDSSKLSANGMNGDTSTQESPSTWDAQLAKLALAAILIDTVNFVADHKVTDHDHKAVKYLEAKIVASPELGPGYSRDAFFKEINDAKSDLDDLTLEEVLRKDYKEWDEGDLTLGISASVRSVAYLKTKEEKFIESLLEYARGRKVDLYALMTSHNESDTFERQLLLIATEDGRPVEVAEKFTKANVNKLQLEDSKTKVDDSGVTWLKMWEQKNLEASRKQVGPLLREAMG